MNYSFENQIHWQCFVINSERKITTLLQNQIPKVGRAHQEGWWKIGKKADFLFGTHSYLLLCPLPSTAPSPLPRLVQGSCILLPPLALQNFPEAFLRVEDKILAYSLLGSKEFTLLAVPLKVKPRGLGLW